MDSVFRPRVASVVPFAHSIREDFFPLVAYMEGEPWQHLCINIPGGEKNGRKKMVNQPESTHTLSLACPPSLPRSITLTFTETRPCLCVSGMIPSDLLETAAV